jgi:hypothetical protein
MEYVTCCNNVNQLPSLPLSSLQAALQGLQQQLAAGEDTARKQAEAQAALLSEKEVGGWIGGGTGLMPNLTADGEEMHVRARAPGRLQRRP